LIAGIQKEGADMRILFAGLFHETHSFVSELTGLDQFLVERGNAILRRRGDGSQIDGFLEVAEAKAWTVMPTVSYSAMPSGTVKDDVFEAFWREVETAARAAVASKIDAVYLSLHGAFVTETIRDPEGELLKRLRAISELAKVPIVGVFDLHANFSNDMAEYANALVCYRENPHTDARETARRAAELLHRALQEKKLPRIYARHADIIWPPTGTGTADSPMRDLENLARELERDNPEFWAVNVVGGYSFADTRDTGVSFSIVTVGLEAAAQAALQKLGDLAFSLKQRGLVGERVLDEVLQEILPISKGPVLLVEPADNIGGGAPGDGTDILRALLRYRVKDSAVVINDPESVAALQGVSLGGQAHLSIGGKSGRLDEGPVDLTVSLLSRSDGRFELEDLNSHLVGFKGRYIEMGPCAVVRCEVGVTILLTSLKTPPFDLGQLRSQGIEPTELSVIGVKAAVGHRRAYDPIAAASFTVRTRGACISDPRALPYKHIARPVYPLDAAPNGETPMILYPGKEGTPRSSLPFSPATQVGNLLFVSGQASVDSQGKIISDTFENEMRRSLGNLQKVLEDCSSDLAHVVQTRNYVRDSEDLATFNRIYCEFFRPPFPARTTIVNCLNEALRYEVECIAIVKTPA
jgi:microcystin degradation protein MlrC